MTYVLSDIHGHWPRFRSILKQIHLQPEDTLYVLGDVIDRYPHGLRVLRQIMAMENAKMLLGNHEYMLLRALGRPRDDNADDGRALAHWYRNGGGVTHSHWKRLRKTMREEIFSYLLGLPLYYDVQVGNTRYKLVHTALAEDFDGQLPYLNPTHYAVWKRQELDAPTPADYTLIFGHSATNHYQDNYPMELWYGSGRIGIDCGCGYSEGSGGRLACLRLEDGAVFYSED